MWVLALLSILAAGIAAASRVESNVVRNRLALAQARAYADAATMLAIRAFLQPDPDHRWPAKGGPLAVHYDGSVIAVTVEDEGGKININLAPAEVIAGLLDEMGVAPNRRASIVDGILAQREADAPPGTDEAWSLSANTPPYGMNWTKLPFAAVSELRQLSGMTRATFNRIRPFVTVFSQTGTINPMTAARPALLAVPGVQTPDVDDFLAARAESGPELAAALLRLTASTPYLAPSSSVQAVTITARAKTAAGGSFVRRAVISLASPAPSQPVAVLRWEQAIDPSDAGAGDGR